MQIIVNLVLIIVVCIMQITILPKMVLFHGFPNIIFLVMIALVFIKRSRDALIWAIAGGIILDLLSNYYFGVYTISFLVIYHLTKYFTEKVFTDPEIIIAAIMIFMGSILVDSPWFITNREAVILLSDALYNTFVGCIIYIFLRYYLKPEQEIKI